MSSFLWSYYADVTNIVVPLLDRLFAAGDIVDIPIAETTFSSNTDEQILVRWIHFPLFGALQMGGDNFMIMDNPITQAELCDPNVLADFLLSVGVQPPNQFVSPLWLSSSQQKLLSITEFHYCATEC